MFTRECQLSRRRFVYTLTLICIGLWATACTSTADLIAKGEENLKKRKFHAALVQFRAAVESDSDSAAGHWGMARAYENLGRFNETVEELRKTVELDSANLEAKAKLGNYFLLVQPPMIGEAEKARDEIVAADANFIEGHILTASIMAATGKPDSEVVATVERAISIDPKRINSYISLERFYVTRQRTADAENALKRGLAEAPEAVAGHVEYGRFLMYSSRDAEAEQSFNKAIAVDGNDVEAREAIAEFFVTSEQLEKAEKAYLDLVAIQDNSPESRLVLADFYKKTGREDEAIATLGQIISESPEYALARYRLGEIYLERREGARVDEQITALLDINDQDVEALMLRARLRMQENRAEEAVNDLHEVLKKQPSSRDAIYLMAQAKLALGFTEQANAFLSDLERYHPSFLNAGLVRIQAAIGSGDLAGALRLSNELVKKTDTAAPSAEMTARMLRDLRARALSSRGLVSLELRKFAEARADLQEVLRLSPKSPVAMINLAKAFVAEGNNAQAYSLYEKAANADARNIDAISGIVNTSIAMGQSAKAHARLDSLIAANAGRGDVLAALHYLRSTVYSAEKNVAETEKQLKIAIESDPDYLTAYSAYANLLVSQDRADEALAQYRQVVERRPAAAAFTMLGILEDSRSNTSGAEQAYRKALELAPGSPIAANNLAWLLAERHTDLDEALRLATMAVSKGQSNAGFYDTLGWIYLQKGLATPAVEQFKKAVALEDATAQRSGKSPAPGYRVRLGMAFAKAGDKASARREVETSLRYTAALTQRELQDARSLLANL